jgi:uncharacterized protein DUF6186
VRRAAVTAALSAYAWWATGLPAFSWAALVAVLGAGVLAIAWGARRPPIHRFGVALSPRRRAAVAVLLAGALCWELASFLRRPRAEHPTLSVFANRLLDPRPVRALGFLAWLVCAAALARSGRRSARLLFLAGWLWLGWHLFVRASR